MRNAKVLTAFYEKVQAELDEACQAVFDKYQPEFEQKVYNQLCEGDTLYQANGTALIVDKKGAHVGDKFTTAMAQFQYSFDLTVGFEITYKIHKT